MLLQKDLGWCRYDRIVELNIFCYQRLFARAAVVPDCAKSSGASAARPLGLPLPGRKRAVKNSYATDELEDG